MCKNCGRGHSPGSNAIVFCDGCNGAWHQFCHDPPIEGEVVRVEEREWVCGACEGGRREREREMGELEGRVRAEGWGAEEVSFLFFWVAAGGGLLGWGGGCRC